MNFQEEPITFGMVFSIPLWKTYFRMPDNQLVHFAKIVVLAAAGLLSGCVPYPIHKTLQPSAQVTVLGDAGQAMQDAEVTLVTNAYPYGFEKRRAAALTAANGMATFDSIREWRIESTMIHGAETFFWNWCIRKEGFATYLTTDRRVGAFQNKLQIQLQPGVSTPCPAPLIP